MIQNARKGFSLIEILIVIAVISILSVLILMGVQRGKLKAYDNSIRNDVGQLRWQAEILYDQRGATYQDWATNPPPSIAEQLAVLREDINTNFGNTDYPDDDVVVILDDQSKEYCISAPLRSDATKYYCVDALATFKTVTAPCEKDPFDQDAPNRCPAM